MLVLYLLNTYVHRAFAPFDVDTRRRVSHDHADSKSLRGHVIGISGESVSNFLAKLRHSGKNAYTNPVSHLEPAVLAEVLDPVYEFTSRALAAEFVSDGDVKRERERLSASTVEEALCAGSILSSRSLSTTASLYCGIGT